MSKNFMDASPVILFALGLFTVFILAWGIMEHYAVIKAGFRNIVRRFLMFVLRKRARRRRMEDRRKRLKTIKEYIEAGKPIVVDKKDLHKIRFHHPIYSDKHYRTYCIIPKDVHIIRGVK